MRIDMLLADGAFDSGITTVNDIFAAANVMREKIDRPPPRWEVRFVGVGRSITTAGGIEIATEPLGSLTVLPEMMIVPALGLCEPPDLVRQITSSTARSAVDHVSIACSEGVKLAAACSGTFFLAEAGVLDGQDATTSWWLGPQFRERYPSVRLDTGERLIIGEQVSTAGAAFAHIDLAIAIVRSRSPAVAELVARYLLIGDQVSQASFAVPSVVAQYHPDVSKYERWIRANLADVIRVSDAAAAIGLSERSLQRATSSVLGMTPIEFLNEVRIDEAAYLLRSSGLSVETVATRVGFQNASTLRMLVKRRRGVTLRQLRNVG